MNKRSFYSYSRGQAALVILAIMAIAMTMAVSVSKRVINDVKVSEQEEQSAKAFSAAEAGIEEAIRKAKEGEELSSADTSAIAESLGVSELNVTSISAGGGNNYLYPITVRPGQSVIIWLRDHDETTGKLDESSGYEGNQLNLCWQSGTAVEAVYFYNDAGTYGIKQFAFDTDAARRGTNHFNASSLASCAGLDAGETLDLSAGTPLFLAVRPFYQQTTLGAEGVGGATLPVQGSEITSSGAVSQGASKIARKVKLFRSWPAPPGAFFSTIFSGGGVSGN